MKLSVLSRFLLSLLLACSATAMAKQPTGDAASTDAKAVSTDKAGTVTRGKTIMKQGQKGFLSPVGEASPRSQPDAPNSVNKVVKQVFDKGSDSSSRSGTASTVRGNNTNCSPVLAGSKSCETVDSILTAHQNQRMDSDDTQTPQDVQRATRYPQDVRGACIASKGGDGDCGR